MSVHQGITIAEISFVLIINKDRSRKIIIFLICLVQIKIIILSLYHRITDLRQCFHIDPADHILIDTPERIKINAHRCYRLFIRLIYLFHLVRITFCHCHFGNAVIFIGSFFIFCINMIKVKSCITENTDCHDQNDRQNMISNCFFLFHLVFPAHNHTPLNLSGSSGFCIYYKYPSVFLQPFCFCPVLYRKKPPRNGHPKRLVRYVLFQSCCYFQASSFPVSILYAWRYFSIVLSTISCGSVQSLSGLAFSQSRANCLSKDG